MYLIITNKIYLFIFIHCIQFALKYLIRSAEINAQVAARLQSSGRQFVLCVAFFDDNAQYKPANVSQHCVRVKLSRKQVTTAAATTTTTTTMTATATTYSQAEHDRQCFVPGQSSHPRDDAVSQVTWCAHKYAAWKNK